MKNSTAGTKKPEVVQGTPHHEANGYAADAIINKYTALSAGAGLVPLPFLDLLAMGALQMTMIHSLGSLYNYKFDEYRAKSIIGVLTTSLPASALIKTTSSLFKLIPFVGPLLGGVSGFMYSAASTYALGKVFNLHFASGLSLLTFDMDKMKASFQEFHEEYISNQSSAPAAPATPAASAK